MTSEDAAQEAQQELIAVVNPRAGEKVCIAYPHQNEFGANFVESVLRNIAYDKLHGNHLMHASGLMGQGALASVWGTGGKELAYARNTAAAAFLASDADWLLWWDTDIGAEQDAVEKLLEAADPVERPIVGALCFVEQEFSHDWRGGLKSALNPTIYDWSWVEPSNGMPGMYKLATRQEWEPGEITRVGATGCGLLLVHRSALEKIANWLHKEGAPASIWYERIPGPDGEMCGEDISFCLRAHEVNVPIWVHTGVSTTHQKTVWYGVEEFRVKPATPVDGKVIRLEPKDWPRLRVNPFAAKDAMRDTPMARPHDHMH